MSFSSVSNKSGVKHNRVGVREVQFRDRVGAFSGRIVPNVLPHRYLSSIPHDIAVRHIWHSRSSDTSEHVWASDN